MSRSRPSRNAAVLPVDARREQQAVRPGRSGLIPIMPDEVRFLDQILGAEIAKLFEDMK
jgi:hypothetical protein